MNAISDAELVARAQAGDRAAFACLFSRHAPMARRVCQRLLGATDGLADVLQEAALQAWLNIERLRKPDQFGAWLAGISLNVARHSLRQSTAHDCMSWDALIGGRLVNEPVDLSLSPAERAELSELSRRVREAVADLPPGQREAVLLVYLGGLSYRETAEVLGVEVSAVRSRLHKGRGSLQRRLRDLWKEHEVSTTQTTTEQQMVPMRVADVRRRPSAESGPDRSLIVLQEVDGPRQLSVWVGRWEGDSIALILEKVKVPRPLTHTFAASLLRAAGVRVPQVRIHRLADETFYAQVVLESASNTSMVDARPSDSVALALEMGAPIFVASDVLAASEAARAARAESGDAGEQPKSDDSLNAAQIVDRLIENWPTYGRTGAKPSR